MSILTDMIVADMATLVAESPTPLEPFGYGQDLSCVDDITDTLDLVDPSSKDAISQALIRRLTCPRGQLIEDPTYGLDLRAYCSRGTTDADIRDLAGEIKTECLKDDRIESVEVSVSYSSQTEVLTCTIWVSPILPSLGEFSLTFALTVDTVVLLEVG